MYEEKNDSHTIWIQKLKGIIYKSTSQRQCSFLLFFTLHPHVMNWPHMSQNCRACTRVFLPSLIPLRSSLSLSQTKSKTTQKYQYNMTSCTHSPLILIHTRQLPLFIVLMYIAAYIFQQIDTWLTIMIKFSCATLHSHHLYEP